MNKSISQATQNDKQISKSIKRFFTRFHVSSALKASNAYKKKGVPVMEIFQYLFLLIFSNRSMYMNLITGRNTPDFAKDTVYRFMKMIQINWIRFTTILSARIIRDAIFPLDSEERANVFIIDDSMFERNRSKKAELLAKVYDHAKHKYLFGFRMLTLGWSDGSSFLPVNSILLSTENRKNRINEATEVDKRTVGYKRRKLSLEKGTQAMLTLLDAAKKAAIPAKYVLFDSWFSSPRTLHAVKSMGYDVIGMVKHMIPSINNNFFTVCFILSSPPFPLMGTPVSSVRFPCGALYSLDDSRSFPSVSLPFFQSFLPITSSGTELLFRLV